MAAPSSQRRLEILDALRRGTVPQRGLDALAVGLDRFETVMDETLAHVAAGHSGFKAVRGDYGCGKTFFARWIQERAKQKGFAVAEVQISETETPLHRLETVYRRLIEHLSTSAAESGAFRSIVDGWFYTLEEDAIAAGADPSTPEELFAAADALMEKRLETVSRTSATFAAVLRAYRRTVQQGDIGTADSLLAWLGGQPNIAASVKRVAQIKGDVDHFTALNFLQGLLVMLRDSGHPGLVLVLGVAYKRDIDDVRESPALDVIRLLEERGAHVEFHDPFVHEFREEGHVRKGVELSDEMLRWADAVVVVTDHKNVDYQRVVDHAALLVDTRNVTAGLKAGRARIIPLASGTRTVGVVS